MNAKEPLYRLLQPKELTKLGDESFDADSDAWIPVVLHLGLPAGGFVIRRQMVIGEFGFSDKPVKSANDLNAEAFDIASKPAEFRAYHATLATEPLKLVSIREARHEARVQAALHPQSIMYVFRAVSMFQIPTAEVKETVF